MFGVGQALPPGNPNPVEDEYGRIASSKRGRESEEVDSQDNDRIEMLYLRIIEEGSLSVSHGFGFPRTAMQALAEAKKINPNHPRVIELDGLLANPPLASEFADKYQRVAQIISDATNSFNFYLDPSLPEEYLNRHLATAVLRYKGAKNIFPEHPQVLAFEEKFAQYADLFQ